MAEELSKSACEQHRATLAATGIVGPICGVYMIEAPNGLKYIGASKNIGLRWSRYRCKHFLTRSQPKLTNSFREYGVGCHRFTILELCPIEVLHERESYYGMLHDTLENGLNANFHRSSFGNATKTQAIRAIISESSRKYRTGKRHSMDTLRKISEAHIGMKRSEEAKIKMCEKKRAGKSCILLDTETGIFYLTMADASRARNTPMSSMSEMLSGKRPNKSSFRYV